ncbi:hypothetical protein BEL01nite_84930 [Bradyrhizobium elkanii]|nr:hypothetical protein BEL01nite_84930 [Bradyrhizobium elkanii]
MVIQFSDGVHDPFFPVADPYYMGFYCGAAKAAESRVLVWKEQCIRNARVAIKNRS